MKQFQVPQFITIEDKIFGPFTLKQFLYLGGPTFIITMAYIILERYLFIIVSLPLAALGISLAFLKVNEQPFGIVMVNALKFFFRPRLYLWKKLPAKGVKKTAIEEKKEEAVVKKIPKLSESKLVDLAWSLDIQEKIRH